jgi:hypothetical protein
MFVNLQQHRIARFLPQPFDPIFFDGCTAARKANGFHSADTADKDKSMMFRESVSILKPLLDQPERRAILGAQSRLKTDCG